QVAPPWRGLAASMPLSRIVRLLDKVRSRYDLGMRIHGLCVVRDEADIVGHALDTALEWADDVHVLDNGSGDGTWELLQDYASREPRVVLVGRDEEVFRD